MFIKAIKKSALTLLFISVLTTSIPLHGYERDELKKISQEVGLFALKYIGIGALLSSGFFLALKILLPGFIRKIIYDAKKDLLNYLGLNNLTPEEINKKLLQPHIENGIKVLFNTLKETYNIDSKVTNIDELLNEISNNLTKNLINNLDMNKIYDEKFKPVLDKIINDSISSALSDEIQEKVAGKLEIIWNNKLKTCLATILQDSTEITLNELKKTYNSELGVKNLKELKEAIFKDLNQKLKELIDGLINEKIDGLIKDLKTKLDGVFNETLNPNLTKTFDHLKKELDGTSIKIFGEKQDENTPILDHATDRLNSNLDKITNKLIGSENSNDPIIDQFTKSGKKQLEVMKIVSTNLLFTLNEEDQKLPVIEIIFNSLLGKREEFQPKDLPSRINNALFNLKDTTIKLFISDENFKNKPVLEILSDVKDKEVTKTLNQLKLNLLGAEENDERSFADILDGRAIELTENQLNYLKFKLLGTKQKKNKESKSLIDEISEASDKIIIQKIKLVKDTLDDVTQEATKGAVKGVLKSPFSITNDAFWYVFGSSDKENKENNLNEDNKNKQNLVEKKEN